MATAKVAGKSDWARVAASSDRQIRQAVADDPDAAPIASAEWIRGATVFEPKAKTAISIRLDDDILSWFKRRGIGYQTRINAVLRAYVEAQR